MFYSNAYYSFDGHEYPNRFKTCLQNTKFEINLQTLAKFLGILDKGEIYTPYNFSSLNSCRVIFDNPNLPKKFTTLKNLSVDICILHLIIYQILNPQTENFAMLYPEDQYGF